MKGGTILILLLLSGALKAQQFHSAYTITLPDSIISVHPARVDLNNDGLLDLLILSETQSGRTYLQVIKGDTTITPFLHWQGTRTLGPVKAFMVTDYDYDNRMDVLLSATNGKVAVYLNRGSFTFSENVLTLPSFSSLLITDLNDDANSEWILSDEAASDGKLTVLQKTGAFMWKHVHDTIRVAASSLSLTDENYDGRPDIFVSGKISADSVVSTVLVSNGQFKLSPVPRFDFVGKTSSADVNADGIFDFVVMGRDKAGTAGTRRIQSVNGTHQAVQVPISLTESAPFVADMNSDGIVDYNFSGKIAGDVLNFIQYGADNYDTIPSIGYRAHVFGDEDRDGDLDLLVVTRSATQTRLLAYENMTQRNGAPSMPKNAVVMRVFDRTFYYWDPSTDDHTPQASITYDLFIDGTNGFTAEFDLLNEKRLSVTHGNNGTQNFKLVRGAPGTQFAVQAVDNSFHPSRTCIGSGGSCGTLEVSRILLCEGEKKTVQAPHEALWFSFAKGYLGKGIAMELPLAASDTVFYYDPTAKGCDALRVMQVVVSDDAVRNIVDKYACVGQSLRLEVEAGWSSVTWQSHKHGALGTGKSIDVIVSEADTITAIMTNAAGCIRRDKTALKISTPVVIVSPEQVRIAIGAEVQLTASGAIRYEWRPATGLSAANIANPLASPAATTSYAVTGYDSLGCSSTVQVIVFVESGGFVPNLFTPNEDGKNDEIKIYGLTEVHDFVFTIHNREGSVVYRSNNLTEAMQTGWDGTRQGTRQPAGVYFWKVKGELASGERLLLNGKDSGSIVLVR